MKEYRKHAIGAVSAISVAILLYYWNVFNLTDEARKVLAIAAFMIILWVTETLALPVVALFPLILFPLLNLNTIDQVALSYADKIIFLFMGGFMIGLAIEKWNLHKRIALRIIHFSGSSGNRIIMGFIMATGLLSMWLSNTATAMMMFPIAGSVILVMQDNYNGQGNIKNFAICIMLAIAYSSNLGGIATIIGTPPNVAYVGHLQKYYGSSISFSNWMMLCLPLAILLLVMLYFVMVKWLFPNNIKQNLATENHILEELKNLGPMSVPEKRVLIIFLCTAALWMFKDLMNKTGLIKLDDSIIAMIGAMALFATPSGNKNDLFLLHWKDTQKMAWGILLLFGGGIALAAQLEKAGLISMLGKTVATYAGSNLFLLVLAIATVSIFISEVMSNVAQVIVFAPVVAGIADALQVNPVMLGLPMALAASCAGMLPMGTPPNAIVFASGHIKLKHMLITGLVMNIICVIAITLFCYLLIPLLITSFHK